MLTLELLSCILQGKALICKLHIIYLSKAYYSKVASSIFFVFKAEFLQAQLKPSKLFVPLTHNIILSRLILSLSLKVYLFMLNYCSDGPTPAKPQMATDMVDNVNW